MSDPSQPAPADADALTDAELQFYYLGLYKVLKRHRYMSVIGWALVAAGLAGTPFGWDTSRYGAIVILALSCCTVIGGIMIVQLGVTSLDSYLSVPFPRRPAGEGGAGEPPVLEVIRRVMEDARDGGFRDAHEAVRTLRSLRESHGLPALK